MAVLKSKLNRDICRKVAEDMGLPIGTVEFIYIEYWKAIAAEIAKIPVEDFDDENKLNKHVKSFTIMQLGKFYTSTDVVKGYRKYEEYKNKKRSDMQSQTTIH